MVWPDKLEPRLLIKFYCSSRPAENVHVLLSLIHCTKADCTSCIGYWQRRCMPRKYHTVVMVRVTERLLEFIGGYCESTGDYWIIEFIGVYWRCLKFSDYRRDYWKCLWYYLYSKCNSDHKMWITRSLWSVIWQLMVMQVEYSFVLLMCSWFAQCSLLSGGLGRWHGTLSHGSPPSKHFSPAEDQRENTAG